MKEVAKDFPYMGSVVMLGTARRDGKDIKADWAYRGGEEPNETSAEEADETQRRSFISPARSVGESESSHIHDSYKYLSNSDNLI